MSLGSLFFFLSFTLRVCFQDMLKPSGAFELSVGVFESVQQKGRVQEGARCWQDRRFN